MPVKKFIDIRNADVWCPAQKGHVQVLDDVSLSVEKREFVTLIGHAGSGKSTLLNLIAGLRKASHGALICDGREIDGPSPDRAMVFQNHSLLPWLSCYQNVHLAVERVFGRDESGHRQKERVMSALALVGLAAVVHKRPHEISDGMKQRVGIARALSMEPKVLLMDEPFGALDALTRAHLQDELPRFIASTGATVIMATRDVDEAVLLSDRIVMLDKAPAATIARTLQVRLPRPRDRMMLGQDPLYTEYRTSVLEFLYKREARIE
jgi:nitrate/nitrite transport system ATP-binding protein